MKTAKKYIAPATDIIKIGMTNMCCDSISDTPADPNTGVMSKGTSIWYPEEED